MKKQTLQALRYISLLCVLSCIALNADDYDSSSDAQNGEKKPFKSTYERIEMQEITPNAGPVVKGGVDAYVEADYILWHVNEGGLAYDLDGSHALAPRFKTSSGFKVGLGLDFSYDGWDMGAIYTWLHSHASRTTSLRTDWKLHFNVVDLELGRNFFVSPKLTLRPHFGLKGTWQTQKFNQLIVGPSYWKSQPTWIDKTLSSRFQDYWGLGIRTGLDASWMVTRCFNVFGKWAFSTVWGQFTNNGSFSGVTTDASGAFINNIVSYRGYPKARAHQLNGVLEMQLGVCYDYWFSDDDYRLRVSAAWENQLWLNQNHLDQFGIASLKGDLSLQGLTLNFRFDF